MNQTTLVFLLLFVSASHAAYPDYEKTDKIQLLFGDDPENFDEKEKLIFNPSVVKLSIQMDIEKVTQVELSDVSSARACKTEDVLPSPSFRSIQRLTLKRSISA